MLPSRRGFLFGAVAIAAAPAIVRVESLMKIVRPPLVLPPPPLAVEVPWIGDPKLWRGIDAEAFRRIIEPGLREAFVDAYRISSADAVVERMSKVADLRARALKRLADPVSRVSQSYLRLVTNRE